MLQKLYGPAQPSGAAVAPAGDGEPASVPHEVLDPWSVEGFTDLREEGPAAADVEPPAIRSSVWRATPGSRRVPGARGLALANVRPAGLARVNADRRSATLPERDLVRYRDVLLRRWKTGAIVFLVIAAGVSAGVLIAPAVYRATGLLEIRREATGTVPVETMFSSERVTSDDLETQFGILRSAAVAQHAIALLAKTAAAPPQNGTTKASAPATSNLPLTVEDLQKALIVNPQEGSRLVEVSFQGPDPTAAAVVVNAVIDSYLQLRMQEAQRSADWLAAQLKDAQGRLTESERRLQGYVREHGLQVLETGQGETSTFVNGRLQALSNALTGAQADRIQKQSTSEQASRQAAARTLDSPVVQDLTVKLADLRREHARLASTFHEEYPSVKALTDQIAEVERALDQEIGVAVNRANREYQAALRRESLIRQALDEENARVQRLGQSGGYEALKRDAVTNQQQVAMLEQKVKEVGISAALKAANVGVVDRARPPLLPYGSPLALTLALAGLVGLMLAVGAIFLQEHFDTSMRSAVEVDAYFGVPTLAAIPAVSRGVRLTRMTALGPGAHGGRRESPLSDAFAALRTAVLLNDADVQPRLLLITSALPQEGKTTVSINLALSLARLQHRVLLVDANMRDPGVRHALGLGEHRGLVDYLTTDADWRACRHQDVHPNLDVIPCGTGATSPADLLSSPRLRDLLAQAPQEYAFVIVDSPALLAHQADVQSLAPLADTVLLTVRQGATPREAVSLALSGLPHVSGVVLNRSDDRHSFAQQQEIAAGA